MTEVLKITFDDHGQDFTEWYVRSGFVIDCQPHQGRVWVGAKLAAPVTEAGKEIRIIPTRLNQETVLNYPAASVEVLNEEQAAEVETFGRRWAEMKGVSPAEWGL